MREVRYGSQRFLVAANGTWQLKSRAGTLGVVVINDPGVGWSIDVYDAVGANSDRLWHWETAMGRGTFIIGMPALLGLRVVAAGATPGQAAIGYD